MTHTVRVGFIMARKQCWQKQLQQQEHEWSSWSSVRKQREVRAGAHVSTFVFSLGPQLMDWCHCCLKHTSLLPLLGTKELSPERKSMLRLLPFFHRKRTAIYMKATKNSSQVAWNSSTKKAVHSHGQTIPSMTSTIPEVKKFPWALTVLWSIFCFSLHTSSCCLIDHSGVQALPHCLKLLPTAF